MMKPIKMGMRIKLFRARVVEFRVNFKLIIANRDVSTFL